MQVLYLESLTPDSPSLAGNGRLTLTSVRLFHDAANATHTAKRHSFAVVMNLANLPHLQGRINRPGRSLELFVSPPLGRQIWHSWPWSTPIASRRIGLSVHSSVPRILQSTLVNRLAIRFLVTVVTGEPSLKSREAFGPFQEDLTYSCTACSMHSRSGQLSCWLYPLSHSVLQQHPFCLGLGSSDPYIASTSKARRPNAPELQPNRHKMDVARRA